MYSHRYGVNLAEMHLDDRTIARLFGYSSLRSVKYYRKMSNQVIADETRQARHKMSLKMLEFLDGWEDECEQIKYDDALNNQESEKKLKRPDGRSSRWWMREKKISIQKRMQKTRLSRGFFYKNPTVRKEVDQALEQ